MYDPGNGQLRYLIHFSDGGSGMRTRDDPLEPGVELVDGGGRYRVVRVEPGPEPAGVRRLGGGRALQSLRSWSRRGDGVLILPRR